MEVLLLAHCGHSHVAHCENSPVGPRWTFSYWPTVVILLLTHYRHSPLPSCHLNDHQSIMAGPLSHSRRENVENAGRENCGAQRSSQHPLGTRWELLPSTLPRMGLSYQAAISWQTPPIEKQGKA